MRKLIIAILIVGAIGIAMLVYFKSRAPNEKPSKGSKPLITPPSTVPSMNQGKEDLHDLPITSDEKRSQPQLISPEEEWINDPRKKPAAGGGIIMPTECLPRDETTGKLKRPPMDFATIDYYFAEKIEQNIYRLRARIRLLDEIKNYHSLKIYITLPTIYDPKAREDKVMGRFLSGKSEFYFVHPPPGKVINLDINVYLEKPMFDILYLNIETQYITCKRPACIAHAFSNTPILHEKRYKYIPHQPD